MLSSRPKPKEHAGDTYHDNGQARHKRFDEQESYSQLSGHHDLLPYIEVSTRYHPAGASDQSRGTRLTDLRDSAFFTSPPIAE